MRWGLLIALPVLSMVNSMIKTYTALITMKLTYVFQISKSMLPTKNGINTTNILYTGSYKKYKIEFLFVKFYEKIIVFFNVFMSKKIPIKINKEFFVTKYIVDKKYCFLCLTFPYTSNRRFFHVLETF